MTEEEALQAKLMPCGCYQLSIWEGNSSIWSELLLWRARTTTLQDEQQAIPRSCAWSTALPVHLQRCASRRRRHEWWQRQKGCREDLRWSEVIQSFQVLAVPVSLEAKSDRGFSCFPGGKRKPMMLRHPSWDWRRGCRGLTFWLRYSCPPFFDVFDCYLGFLSSSRHGY